MGSSLTAEYRKGSKARNFPFTSVFIVILALLKDNHGIERLPNRHIYRIFYELSQDRKLAQRFPLTFISMGGEPYSGELEMLISDACTWGVISMDSPRFERIMIELESKQEVLEEMAEDFPGINLENSLAPVAARLHQIIGSLPKERA